MSIKQTLGYPFEGKDVKNYELKNKRLWLFMVRLMATHALCAIMMYAYIEIGHDKGWKCADVWYTCLHTHNHFSWQ